MTRFNLINLYLTNYLIPCLSFIIDRTIISYNIVYKDLSNYSSNYAFISSLSLVTEINRIIGDISLYLLAFHVPHQGSILINYFVRRPYNTVIPVLP